MPRKSMMVKNQGVVWISLESHETTFWAFAFETRPKLSELAKLNTNEIKLIPPTELVCNLYLLIREDLSLGVRWVI